MLLRIHVQFAAVAIGLIIAVTASSSPATCSYTTYLWNTRTKSSVLHRDVRKPYGELTKDEVDPATGCSVCEEDQVEVGIPGVKPFQVCGKVAEDIRMALRRALQGGGRIVSVTGYRVGKTRGGIDKDGNRTGFSNHSFGVAVDVNEAFNGLYDHCPTFGPHCRLIKAGPWLPDRVESLRPAGPVVKELKAIGFRWGGEIPGQQKDFMHFSRSGY